MLALGEVEVLGLVARRSGLSRTAARAVRGRAARAGRGRLLGLVEAERSGWSRTSCWGWSRPGCSGLSRPELLGLVEDGCSGLSSELLGRDVLLGLVEDELLGLVEAELLGLVEDELLGLVDDELLGLVEDELLLGLVDDELLGLVEDELLGLVEDELLGLVEDELLGLVEDELVELEDCELLGLEDGELLWLEDGELLGLDDGELDWPADKSGMASRFLGSCRAFVRSFTSPSACSYVPSRCVCAVNNFRVRSSAVLCVPAARPGRVATRAWTPSRRSGGQRGFGSSRPHSRFKLISTPFTRNSPLKGGVRSRVQAGRTCGCRLLGSTMAPPASRSMNRPTGSSSLKSECIPRCWSAAGPGEARQFVLRLRRQNQDGHPEQQR